MGPQVVRGVDAALALGGQPECLRGVGQVPVDVVAAVTFGPRPEDHRICPERRHHPCPDG